MSQTNPPAAAGQSSSTSTTASSIPPTTTHTSSHHKSKSHRRDSFDALGRAILNTQQHQLHQQQQFVPHHLQQHSLGGSSSTNSNGHAHSLSSTPATFSPSRSPAASPALPSSPSRPIQTNTRHLSTPMFHNTQTSSIPLPPHPYANGPNSFGTGAYNFSARDPTGHEFPFPALSTLNRSRLLHLLEHQCNLSEQKDADGQPIDEESSKHYRVLLTSIKSLNLSGGVYNFSFVHSSSIAVELLANMKSSDGSKGYASRLTAVHLIEILHAIRNSTSPNLADPQELPAGLLDAGIFYRPDETNPAALQLSPFVYHRVLAMLSFLLNLHIHQLTLASILKLLQGIDKHLDYWLTHQALTSLPLPYRAWKYFQYKWHGSSFSHVVGHHSSFTSSFSGLTSPRKRQPKDSQTAPLSPPPAISSNPYANWTKMAARNVRELVELKKKWTTRCGRIAMRMHHIQDWLNQAFGKTANVTPVHNATPHQSTHASAAAITFHQQIAMNEVYLAKIYRYVVREDMYAHNRSSSIEDIQPVHFTPSKQTRSSFGSSSSSSSLQSQPQTIQQKIYGLYAQFAHFEHYLVCFETQFVQWFENEIHIRRKPHHLFQYWHWYTGSAVIIGCGLWYGLRNQNAVKSAYQNAIKSTRFFLNEHLFEPVSNIYDTTFKTFHDRSLFSTSEKTLIQSKDNLSAMLSDFARHHVSELSAHEQKERQEYTANIEQRSKEGDMNLVMKPYNREIQHPIWSLLFGDLMRGLLIQVQKVKVDTEAAMLAMDQILKSNNINFNILATIPFLLLVYGSIDFVDKYVFTGTWNSKRVRAKVRESKKILTELEQIYILHLTPATNAITSSDSHRRHERPTLHTSFQTLTIDEYAALGDQFQEDEDEALRMTSPPATNSSDGSSSQATRGVPHLGTEVFGILDDAIEAVEPVSDEEREEDAINMQISSHINDAQPASVAASHPTSSSARSLFPSATLSTPSSSTLVSRPPLLGLNNHAYGHTLLLIHELSARFASLPLSSSFSSSVQLTSSGVSQDPRLILHRDCILLASDQLSPEQKYRWILNMWHAYSFLAAP